jgi:hypothetical protein
MDNEKVNKFMQSVLDSATPENIQKYILGTKSNGTPRAVYDIVKDFTTRKGKRRKRGKDIYSLYLGSKKRKKKNKRNKNKDWKI